MLKSPDNAVEYAEINDLMRAFKVDILEEGGTSFSYWFDCVQKQQRGVAAFHREMKRIRDKKRDTGGNKYI